MPRGNPFLFLKRWTALLCVAVSTLSCALDSVGAALGHGNDPNRIRIMTWNTQTFFDDQECGREFDEFRGGESRWNAEKYEGRLNRLRDTLLQAGKKLGMGSDRGPDIVALQEIENTRVLRDICNRMPALGAYSHAAFVPPTAEGAFGVALLSKYPIRSVTAHTPHVASVSVRPLLQATLDTALGPLALFVVHWKSKVGETAAPSETAPPSVRYAQEGTLSACIEKLRGDCPEVPYIVCGDFNCGPGESALLGALPGIWERYGDDGGSYWYSGSWERIDNILWSDTLESGHGDSSGGGLWTVSRSFPLNDPPLTDAGSRPRPYRIGTDGGYSDHLPLLAELTLDKRP